MRYVIWGATGQARVLRPIVDQGGHDLSFLIDQRWSLPSPFPGVPILSPDDAVAALHDVSGFVVAIGGANGGTRAALSARLMNEGLHPLSAVHPRAHVAQTAIVGAGLQVMAMACVSEGARLGAWVIVNTSASVDHDCRLGDGVHIMPGATLAGEVTVGDGATVGSNATVLPRISVGAGAMVAAGAVVTRDVPAGATVVGGPARLRPKSSVAAPS